MESFQKMTERMPEAQHSMPYRKRDLSITHRTVFLLTLLCGSGAISQEKDIPRDTSYTLQSAYTKYKKYYPDITPVPFSIDECKSIAGDITYSTIGNRQLRLDLFSPAPTNSSLHPVVMLIHGGGWSSGDKSLMHPLADAIAQHGYIAVTVEYRLSPEARYPAGVNDLKNAINWLRQHGDEYRIDINRITLLGCSAGAQLAGLVGLTDRAPDPLKPIAAIINIDGVMDFTNEKALKHENNPENKSTAAGRWFGGSYEEVPQLWKEASPIYYVTSNSPSMLFLNSSQPRFHAGRDEVIAKLNQYDIWSEVHTFDDTPHSFWLFNPWFRPTVEHIVTFLDHLFSESGK